MNWPEIYLICFGVGSLWSLVSLLAGGLHLGHFGHGHGHISGGHTGHGHLHARPRTLDTAMVIRRMGIPIACWAVG